MGCPGLPLPLPLLADGHLRRPAVLSPLSVPPSCILTAAWSSRSATFFLALATMTNVQMPWNSLSLIVREVCSSFDVLLAANGCLMAHVPGRPVSALLVMARLERVEWARWETVKARDGKRRWGGRTGGATPITGVIG